MLSLARTHLWEVGRWCTLSESLAPSFQFDKRYLFNHNKRISASSLFCYFFHFFLSSIPDNHIQRFILLDLDGWLEARSTPSLSTFTCTSEKNKVILTSQCTPQPHSMFHVADNKNSSFKVFLPEKNVSFCGGLSFLIRSHFPTASDMAWDLSFLQF